MHRPPLIALHGNLGSCADWDQLALEDLFAVDLWEHSHLSFAGSVSMLSDVVNGWEEKPILLGYSLGGRLALNAFVELQMSCAAAVIVSAHPGLETEYEREERRKSDRVWAEKIREMEWSDFLKEWDTQRVFHGHRSPGRRRDLGIRREEVARAFENWSLGRQPDLRGKIAALTKPILWVTGDQDGKFTSLGAGMPDLNPLILHQTVMDCGHRVPFEKPEALSRLVNDFRDRLID